MIFRAIMTLVARVHFRAAREPKPAVAPPIMGTCAPPGQRLAGVQAELFLPAAGACGRRELAAQAGGVGEELDIRNLEGEAGVAFAADVGGGFAADRDEARGGGG